MRGTRGHRDHTLGMQNSLEMCERISQLTESPHPHHYNDILSSGESQTSSDRFILTTCYYSVSHAIIVMTYRRQQNHNSIIIMIYPHPCVSAEQVRCHRDTFWVVKCFYFSRLHSHHYNDMILDC